MRNVTIASCRIKTLRQYQNMTQAEFAWYLGIPLRTIVEWEAGRRNPPIYVVNLIENKFDYDRLRIAITANLK